MDMYLYILFVIIVLALLLSWYQTPLTPNLVFDTSFASGIRLMDVSNVLTSDAEKSTEFFDTTRSTRLASNTIERTPGFPTVIDQGPWGSCTAFAMRYAYLYWMAKKNLAIVEPSTSFWYANSRVIANVGNANYYKIMKDTGSTTSATVQAISQHGTASLTNYPYTAASIFVYPLNPNLNIGVTRYNSPTALTFTRIPVYAKTSLLPAWQVQGEAFAAQIDAGNAILVSFTVYSNMMTNSVFISGTIPLPAGPVRGGHAICLTGYTRGLKPEENVFSFYNSWGTYTGIGGKFTVPWRYICNSSMSGDYWAV